MTRISFVGVIVKKEEDIYTMIDVEGTHHQIILGPKQKEFFGNEDLLGSCPYEVTYESDDKLTSWVVSTEKKKKMDAKKEEEGGHSLTHEQMKANEKKEEVSKITLYDINEKLMKVLRHLEIE